MHDSGMIIIMQTTSHFYNPSTQNEGDDNVLNHRGQEDVDSEAPNMVIYSGYDVY